MAELTERQSEIYELWRTGLGAKAIGARIGCAHQTVHGHIKAIVKKGYSRGDGVDRSPLIQAGRSMGKVTTQAYYDQDGKPVIEREWVRHSPDAVALEAFVDSLVERVAAKPAKPIKPPKKAPSDAADLNEIVLGDPHFGMLSWNEETGEDWDLKIAESMHLKAIQEMLLRAGPAKHTVLASLGDTFHVDNRSSKTEHSGNVLDTDTRYAKMLDCVTRSFCAMIDLAAQTGERVTVVLVQGNHDHHSTLAAQRILAAYYRNTEHIEVLVTPNKQNCRVPTMMVHDGDIALWYTHGDRIKTKDLVQLIATDYRKVWGSAQHRAARMGHIHHAKQLRHQPSAYDLEEESGMLVEHFRTLAAKDAWHAESGYRSGRSAQLIQHSQEHGEVARFTVYPSMLRA